MKCSVFISYRREGGEGFAQMFNDKLSRKHYRVFYDIESIGVGLFDQKILQEIEQTDVFLLILTKDALNRCENSGDWVRCEIAHAISLDKPIIPLFFRGFEFPQNLPQDIARVALYNGVDIRDMNFFDSKFKQLCSMIDDAAKAARRAPVQPKEKPQKADMSPAPAAPAAPAVAAPLPKTAPAIEYFHLAQKPRFIKKFLFRRANYVCMYKSDYYFLLAAEQGHIEAFQYILKHKIAPYKNGLSAFSYKNGSLNFARVKFLSLLDLFKIFANSNKLSDNDRLQLWYKLTSQLEELAGLGYAPAEILLACLHDQGFGGPYLACGKEAIMWIGKYSQPHKAAQLKEKLRSKGICM